MLDHALVLKQYPRQQHTKIDIQNGDNHWSTYEGRYTEVTLYGAMAATIVEVNTYDTVNSAEPTKHEILVGPKLSITVRAQQDEGESKWTPEPEPEPQFTPLPDPQPNPESLWTDPNGDLNDEDRDNMELVPKDNGEPVQDAEPKQSKSQMKRRRAGMEDPGDTGAAG